MDGGYGPERDGSTRPVYDEEGEVEEEGEGEVDGDGGEEEGPRRTPGVGVAPAEADDGWVLREPEC